ncbi:MAG: diguanylate cyclase [Planctomycetota bacterium]|nr:diguanylate cyclase [Planctomycetota bacterium]
MDSSQWISSTVIAWSLVSLMIGILVGFLASKAFLSNGKSDNLEKSRKKTLETLQELLANTEKFNSNVGTLNQELHSVKKSVSDLQPREIETVQQSLLQQIQQVVESNQKLENDLRMTQHLLEQQAHEIDRTRTEARTDELSGLENRKAFDETLEYLLTRHHSKGTPFALLLCDLDNFKRINDDFGHQVGDQVIRIIAMTLKDSVRPQDHVIRFGGDEFAVLLDGVSPAIGQDVSVRIRNKVAGTIFPSDLQAGDNQVTVSMGFAFALQKDTMETLLKRADQALYRSKEAGRNQLHCWDESNNLVQIY